MLNAVVVFDSISGNGVSGWHSFLESNIPSAVRQLDCQHRWQSEYIRLIFRASVLRVLRLHYKMRQPCETSGMSVLESPIQRNLVSNVAWACPYLTFSTHLDTPSMAAYWTVSISLFSPPICSSRAHSLASRVMTHTSAELYSRPRKLGMERHIDNLQTLLPVSSPV
jgi:hypothetical protein